MYEKIQSFAATVGLKHLNHLVQSEDIADQRVLVAVCVAIQTRK